jgi:hypothetical protein
MTGLTRRLRRSLWSSPVRDLAGTVEFQRRAFIQATWLVRAFYAASTTFVVIQMGGWSPYLDLDTVVDPQWPVAWLDGVDVSVGIRVILAGHVLTTLWAMVAPRSRWARLAAFLLLLEYVGLVNSFGKVNHDIHAWLWVSGVLVLLPAVPWHGRTTVTERHRFLTVLWSAQALVLFFYTLSGLWKVYYAARDLLDPARTSSLELDGFSTIVADRLTATAQETLLGETLIQLPALGWLLYVGTIYLEATSLVVAFRPRLHRLWGLGLILFHVGTQLAMGFTFRHSVLLLGLLLVCSPWAPDRVGVGEVVRDLPGVRGVIALWQRRRRPAPAGAASAI